MEPFPFAEISESKGFPGETKSTTTTVTTLADIRLT